MGPQAQTRIACPVDTSWCTDHELLGAGEECVTLIAVVPLRAGSGVRTAHRPGDAVVISVQQFPGEPARVEIETPNTTDLDEVHWWTAAEAEAVALAQLRAARVIRGADADLHAN